MALPLPNGLTPPEMAFLAEMELVTVIPRQKLDSLPLLSGSTPSLQPNRSIAIPLHLALLLHTQRRATILPPPWLSPDSLSAILSTEMENDVFSPNPPFSDQTTLSKSKSSYYGSGAVYGEEEFVTGPPFLGTSTTESREGRLPYHWFEVGELLLAGAPDSFIGFSNEKGTSGAENIRRLLRDIREVRKAKLRAGMKALEGGGVVSLRGVGGMEVVEERGYVTGIIDGLRQVGASREGARREREQDGGVDGDDADEDDDNDEMDL